MRPVFLQQLTHAPKNIRPAGNKFRNHFSSVKRLRMPLAALSVLALLSIVVIVVQAAAKTWNNAGTDFNTAANWTGGVPGTDDVGLFTAAPVNQPNLSASLTIAGLRFSNGSSGYILTNIGGAVLTLNGRSTTGTTGTTTASASAFRNDNVTGITTINAPLTLAPSTFISTIFQEAADGSTLILNGAIGETGAVALSMKNGTIQLNNANAFSGGSSIDAAGTILVLGNDSALGTGTFTNAATSTLQAGGGTRTLANPVVLGGNMAISGSNGFTFNGSVTSSGSLTRTLTALNTGGATLAGNVFLAPSDIAGGLVINGTSAVAISGVIANNSGGNTVANALTYSGSSTLTLSNTNTYSGGTLINNGTLALTGTGSMANSPVILFGLNATFDVSGRTSTLTLTDSQTLNDPQVATGTINAGANSGLTMGADSDLALTYTNGTPTLNVTGGAFTLQSGNDVTVTVVGGALAPGDYTLISSGAGGSVAGTTPTSLTITGDGTDPNTSTSLEIIGGQLILHVTALPDISIRDARVAEPTTGSRNMIFTVALSAPATGAVQVNFTTNTGGANPATSGSDFTPTNGTVNFAIGEQVKTISVPVLADADNTETDETFLVDLAVPVGATIADGQATGTITVANPAGTLIISELRTSGPGGSNDDFVEVYNSTNSPLTIAASDVSAGYGLFKMGSTCTATPVLLGVIPNGTVIPARGHYLFVGSAYSLANYGGTGAAAGNLTMTSDVENDRNVGIFTTADLANISSINRLDAVGYGLNTGGVCDLLREGSTLGPLSGTTTQHSYFRKGGEPLQDTNDNLTDFRFADTQGTFISGVTQKLGAPGPENLASPYGGGSDISVSRLDTTQINSAAPNFARDFTSNPGNNSTFGTISIRRRVTNNTGTNVTRMRFRIYQITTFPSPGGGVADLRPITSGDVSVSSINDATTCSPAATPCTLTVKGTTLEQPPSQPNGGGYNSTFSEGTITSGTPLANGASTSVQFLFGVQQTGTFNLLMVVEAQPGTGGAVVAAQGSTEGGPTAADSNISGQVLDSDGNPLAGTVINLNGTQNRKMITDADGNYVFDKVETTGLYTVTPERANYGFNPGSRSLSQLGNHTEATFTATPTGGFVNPLATPEYLVRQHYLDFLGREPDEAGFNFWSDQILECGSDAVCMERRTINVSAAYFLSIEFQRTGGLVDRLYRASYGRNARYSEFMSDRSSIAHDVVVGRSGWEAKLAANEDAFVDGWVGRSAFKTAFDGLSNAEYVNHLIANTGVSFGQAERESFVNSLHGGASRADVLQQIAGNENFAKARFNQAFVLMEYFGYLRRDPDESGYQFWVKKLNQFNGNFERAEMVKAFINSTEYRARFAR